MAKNDSEFGDWKSTMVLGNKITIKSFDKGVTIKQRGNTEELRLDWTDTAMLQGSLESALKRRAARKQEFKEQLEH